MRSSDSWRARNSFLQTVSPLEIIILLPILAAFVVSITHFAALYRLRVRIPRSQMFGAAIAAMSVQWTVARAVAECCTACVSGPSAIRMSSIV